MKIMKHVYEWHKEQLWVQFALILTGAILLYSFNLNPLFVFAIYLVTVAKVILGLKIMNVNTASVNDQENFSWKYYQSLPLTKKELYHLYLLNHCFNYLPAVFWFLCFHRHLALEVFEESPQTFLKWFPAALILLFSFGTQSFKVLVTYPRIHFSKLNKRILVYQNLKNFLLYGAWTVTLLLFAGVFTKYLFEFHPGTWKRLGDFFEAILVWQSVYVVFILMAVLTYFDDFKIWINESRGTPRLSWNPKRDVPLTFFSLAMIYVPISLLSFERDGGLALHDAIIDGNMKEVERLLVNKESINEKNHFGYTPLMTAAGRGKSAIFHLLLEKGASQEGVSIESNGKEADLLRHALEGGQVDIVASLLNEKNANAKWWDASPLHQASRLCHPEIVSLLIEKGAEINNQNINGRTALHFASRANCFPAAALLLEAGADPLIIDKDKKLAYQYGSKSNRSPASFIEQKAKKLKAKKQ